MRITVHLRAVGGQSLPLVVDMLARKLTSPGSNVYARQSFGMAQRYGIVAAQIDLEYPDIPGPHRALLLAFERLEGLRAFSQLRPGDLAYIASAALVPPGAHMRADFPYPASGDVEWCAAESGIRLRIVEADAAAPWRVVQAAFRDDAFAPAPECNHFG